MTTQPDNDCDPDLYENSRTVCVLAGASTVIEAMVVRVREVLGVSLDWHYVGGRANVLTTAPHDRDKDILRELEMAMPVLLAMSGAACGQRTSGLVYTNERVREAVVSSARGGSLRSRERGASLKDK